MKLFGGVFDLKFIEKKLKEIEDEISAPDAWNDQTKITPLLREKAS